jgi:PncC family amidohydrolase
MNDLVQRVSDRLARRGLHLALAESCTGGLVSAQLTDRPGASRFLIGALVTYSDDAKIRLLGVRADTLATHGAVSEAVVREMAGGARRACAADLAIAVTGIAGPDGGTPDKPVGTVWLAVAAEDSVQTRKLLLRGDRRAVREQTVRAALDMLDRLTTD